MTECHLIHDQHKLASWVKSATGPIDIAVAFWGNGAIKALGLTNENRPTRILLELSAGGTNPDVVKKLMKLRHIHVKQLSRLHAKAYITSCAVAIGSTNASANGLGLEGNESTRWHELCCIIEEQNSVREAKQWFDEMWNSALPISKSDLNSSRRAWNQRQRVRPRTTVQTTQILEAAIANPDEFRNRGIYVVVTTEDLDDRGRADAEDFTNHTGRDAFGWQDWLSMPRDATLICFSAYETELITWDKPKVCYSPRKPMRYRSLTLVTPTSLGKGFKTGSITTWRKALVRAQKELAEPWNSENGLCIDLGEFAERFGPDADNAQRQ